MTRKSCVGVPGRNVIYSRYIFNSRSQVSGESFETFYTEISKLVEDCDYKTFKSDLLRDIIVIGIKDNGLKNETFKKEGTHSGYGC